MVDVRLTVPDTLVPHVNGALASLWQPWKWEKFGALTVDETMQLIALMFLDEYQGPNVGHVAETVDVVFSKNITYSGAISWVIDNASAWGVRVYTNNTVSNWVEYTVPLSAGTWKLDTWYQRANNMPVTTVTLDGTQVGQTDCYVPGGQADWLVTYTEIVVANTGNHALRLTAGSKNASSSGYYQAWYHHRFTRTG